MSRYKLVVLDMAGTTVEEGGIVYRTLRECVENQGFPVGDEKLSQVAGMNKYEAVSYLLTGSLTADQALTDTVFEDFKRRLNHIYLHDPSVTEKPGITALFKKLRDIGIRIALNTGYVRSQADILIDRFRWREHIDDSITSDEVAHGRPHANMIHALMQRAGLERGQDVVKVGDTVNDILEGKQARCGLVVGVLGGAHHKSLLKEAGADLILENTSDLEHYLTGK